MKTFLIGLVFTALSPALANANCLMNDYNEKVCVGDTAHPWKQKVIKVDEATGMVLLQETNGTYTAFEAGLVRVQPREKYGYRVGQAISNPQVSLQIVDVTYEARLVTENSNAQSAAFKTTQQLYRTVPTATSIQERNRQEQDANDEGYRFLGRGLVPQNLKISQEQMNSIKDIFANSDTQVQVSTIPLNVKIVSIDPSIPTVLVSYETNGATKNLHLLKSELDLFTNTQTQQDFQSGCNQINICKTNQSWGKK